MIPERQTEQTEPLDEPQDELRDLGVPADRAEVVRGGSLSSRFTWRNPNERRQSTAQPM